MNISIAFSAMNGFLPVMQLVEHAAHRIEVRFAREVATPRHCSGDMYAAVPSVELAAVRAVTSVSLAMPKSVSLIVPSLSIIRLDGLRSRWMMPLLVRVLQGGAQAACPG